MERSLRGDQVFPKLKQDIGDDCLQGKSESHDQAPQPADFAFIERVKAAWRPT